MKTLTAEKANLKPLSIRTIIVDRCVKADWADDDYKRTSHTIRARVGGHVDPSRTFVAATMSGTRKYALSRDA